MAQWRSRFAVEEQLSLTDEAYTDAAAMRREVHRGLTMVVLVDCRKC